MGVPIERIEFVGLIGNRLLTQITTNEFMNALGKLGWGEAPNAHILQRLRERGAAWGIRTPNDFAQALRDGRSVPADQGAMRRECRAGLFWVIYRAETSRFITIRHPRD